MAVDALRALREVGGEEAVRTFARRRAEQAIGAAREVDAALPVIAVGSQTARVAAAAGAMFYLYGTAESIAGGVAHAKELIDSGEVAAWLTKHEEANYGSADRA